MSGKRNTKRWRVRKKAVGRAPNWLKTIQIAKSGHFRMPGTFGAASEVVSIDPATGLPRSDGAAA